MARTMRFWLQAVSIVLAILIGPAESSAQSAPPRLALVIGNADYRAGRLPTAANDAGLVAQAFAQAGFEVSAAVNLDADGLRSSVDAFVAKARAAGSGATLAVYLAGYGLQYAGGTMIVPVAAQIGRDADVPGQTVALDDLIKPLAAVPARMRVVVADLARATPFAKSGAPLAPGLAMLTAPAGMVIAYNAAPGTEAPVDASPYGAYARAFAEMLRTPGLSLTSLFMRVRLRVDALTNGAAIPWTAGPQGGDMVLSPATEAPATPAAGPDVTSSSGAYAAMIASDTLADQLSFLTMFPTDPLAPRVRLMAAIRREATTWTAAVALGTPQAVWTYMRRYSRGPHHADARRRLAALHAPLEPPPRFEIVPLPDVAPPPASETDLLGSASTDRIDPKWTPVPRAPASMLPPQPDALAEDLAPPPLAPAGVLPVPMPILFPGAAQTTGATGAIRQADVPDLGEVVTTSSIGATGSVMTVTAKGAVLSKASEAVGATRSILQTDPAGAIISKTDVLRDGGGSSIVQTGPGGGIVLKIATHAAPGGGRSTVVTNGNGETLSTSTRDDQGVVTAVKRGSISSRELDPVFRPAASGQRPLLLRPVLPPPAPTDAAVETDALASPNPPPPLSLPPLPTPAPAAAPKSAAAGPAAPAPAETAKPAAAAVSATPAAATPPVAAPSTSVPEPPRRPGSVAPKRPEKPKVGKGHPPARAAAKGHSPKRRR